MKSLFGDNRLANLLHLFHNTQTLSVTNMAAKLNVSDRTIRNDIKQLNQMLKGCALIDGTQGRYSLRVFDAEGFRAAAAELCEEDDFLNSPRNRMDYLFGKLMRSDLPVITDDLAYEMSIGRTTLMGDLKKLRSELEEYQLTIVGKTSKGLTLYGSETDIRRYVLDNCFDAIYRTYPMDEEIEELIEDFFTQKRLETVAQKNFHRFAVLMLDRFLTGHYIGKMSERFYDLTARPEFGMVNALVDRIGESIQIPLPVEEKLFVLLPILGMRTPADVQGMRSIELDESVRPLLSKIVDRIRLELNLSIQLGDFTEEFLYHLMFMVNRLRFGIRLSNPMKEDLIEKYPLAYQVAGIAARVVEQERQIQVTPDEQAYLATYFGVLLTESQIRMEKRFCIAAVYTTGRITARLVETQLRRVIPHGAELTMLPVEQATEERLEDFDLVLTTVPLKEECSTPVIAINEIFNEQELRRKIDKARYLEQVDSPVLDGNWFVMAGILKKECFFVLDSAKSYEENLRTMVQALEELGCVDTGFLERLEQREEQSTMVFTGGVALPHTVQYATDRLTLAVGVLPKGIRSAEREVNVVFLLGLPEQLDEEDNLLIRIYDEIITIAQDSELRERIAAADNYQTLLQALYREAQ